MKKEHNLRYRINKILAEWNPICVPEFIAEDEYSSYVDQIISIGEDSDLLTKYLISIVIKDMGLAFDEQNASHKSDLNDIVKKIIALY